MFRADVRNAGRKLILRQFQEPCLQIALAGDDGARGYECQYTVTRLDRAVNDTGEAPLLGMLENKSIA